MPAAASKSKVYFFFQETSFHLGQRNRLKDFLRKMVKAEGLELGSLNLVFCTDPILLDINKRFLSHDFYTDIITFDLSDTADRIDGEIYISADRVRENARELSLSFRAELHRVIFHGVLHLCGYGDKTPVEKQTMRRLESKYLRKYGIPVPRETVSW